MKSSKILATLIILAFASVFAQEPQEPQQETVPEPQQELQQVVPEPQQAMQQAMSQPPTEGIPNANIITVDFGPTIIGIVIGSLPVGKEVDLSGFGISMQYERQLFERLSIAGRFAYLGSTVERSDNDTKFTIDLSSFSLEAHPRVYPFGGSFFLDGMLGFANMSLGLKGDIKTKSDNSEPISGSVSRGYFKSGVKLGWRADFGEPGGFIFEHSYGWYNASGTGKTMGKQIEKKVGEEIDSDVDKMFSAFEDYIFVGGPRVTFAFGWRF